MADDQNDKPADKPGDTPNDKTEGERESADERKERVLHTRIPESLDGEIRRRAHSLGLSVSTLVRNILSNTFGLVEDIVADSAELARSARGESSLAGRERRTYERSGQANPPPPRRVLGWQPVTLAMNALCDGCNGILKKGSDAAVAITDGDGPKPFLCLACLAVLKAEPAPE